MEMQTIVQRIDRYYLISTVDHKAGDWPFVTTIRVVADTPDLPSAPVYRCYHKKEIDAISGHQHLVTLWPGP